MLCFSGKPSAVKYAARAAAGEAIVADSPDQVVHSIVKIEQEKLDRALQDLSAAKEEIASLSAALLAQQRQSQDREAIMQLEISALRQKHAALQTEQHASTEKGTQPDVTASTENERPDQGAGAVAAAAPSRELIQARGEMEELRAAYTRSEAARQEAAEALERANGLAAAQASKMAEMEKAIEALNREVEAGAHLHDEAGRAAEALHSEQALLKKQLREMQGEMKAKEDMLELLEQQLQALSDVNVEELLHEAKRTARNARNSGSGMQ